MKFSDINGARTLRAKTFCAVCGREITPADDYIRVEGVAYGGGACFAHRYCLRVRDYGVNPFKEYDGDTFKVEGTLSASGFIIAPEWETMSDYPEEKRLLLYKRAGVLPTHDCTVRVEYLGRPRATLHGVRAWCKTMLREAGNITEDCGTHLNFSTALMREGRAMESIHIKYGALFNPVREAIRRAGSEERVRVLGSDFRYYADYEPDCTDHRAFIAVRRKPTDGRNCIEFRLPRAVDEERFNNAAFLVKEWSKSIDLFLDHKITPERAGKQILTAWEAVRKGEAQFQKRAK